MSGGGMGGGFGGYGGSGGFGGYPRSGGGNTPMGGYQNPPMTFDRWSQKPGMGDGMTKPMALGPNPQGWGSAGGFQPPGSPFGGGGGGLEAAWTPASGPGPQQANPGRAPQAWGGGYSPMIDSHYGDGTYRQEDGQTMNRVTGLPPGMTVGGGGYNPGPMALGNGTVPQLPPLRQAQAQPDSFNNPPMTMQQWQQRQAGMIRPQSVPDPAMYPWLRGY